MYRKGFPNFKFAISLGTQQLAREHTEPPKLRERERERARESERERERERERELRTEGDWSVAASTSLFPDSSESIRG